MSKKSKELDELTVFDTDRRLVINGKTCVMRPMTVGNAAQFLRSYTRIRNIMLSYAGPPPVTVESVAKEFPLKGLAGKKLQEQLARQQAALDAAPTPEQRINSFQAAYMNADVTIEVLPMLSHCLEGIELNDIPMSFVPELVKTWLDQNMNEEILKNWRAVDNQVREISVRVSDLAENFRSPEPSSD